MRKKDLKINIVTLGCSKNLVDSEVLMRQLKNSNFIVGHETIKNPDIVIINTCGFINDAKEESINTIIEYANLKTAGKIKELYVFGCLSERYKIDLEKELPEVDAIFGVNNLPDILKQLNAKYNSELLYQRELTTPPHYAYLKISEGCNRKCSFCAIPMIRGKHTSKTIDNLMLEAEYLSKKGVKELILIAQDLTYYGHDLTQQFLLPKLLENLEKIAGIKWIRLQYMYPAQFPKEIIKQMQESHKICKYIDLPIQHISDSVLKSMQRGHSEAQTKKLIDTFRSQLPDAALRTTLITGFPNETEEDFEKMCRYINEIKFDRLGVFAYSEEEGTKAALLPDNISSEIKKYRLETLMDIQQTISLELNQHKIGKSYKVLIDRMEDNVFIGRTEFDSPEVDNEVIIKNTDNVEIGSFYQVEIESATEFDLFGTIKK